VIGYPSGQDGAILPAQDTGLSCKKNLSGFGVLSHNKSFIDHLDLTLGQ